MCLNSKIQPHKDVNNHLDIRNYSQSENEVPTENLKDWKGLFYNSHKKINEKEQLGQ